MNIIEKSTMVSFSGGHKLFDEVNKPPSSPTKACKPHKYWCRGALWMFPLGNSKLNAFFEQVWAPAINTKFDLLNHTRKISKHLFSAGGHIGPPLHHWQSALETFVVFLYKDEKRGCKRKSLPI